jgi:hypothetical protein
MDCVEERFAFEYDDPLIGGEGAKGRLVQVSDVAGAMRFRHDRHGCVLERIQAIGSTSPDLTRTTQHHCDCDCAGRLGATTLPSGAVIGYAYGVDGRVLTITVNGVTIVREIETFPFGEPKAWTEGASANGFRYERSCDTDGRVAHHRLGEDVRSLSYDAALAQLNVRLRQSISPSQREQMRGWKKD